MKNIKQIQQGCNEGNWCKEGHLCSRCQEMLDQTEEIIKIVDEFRKRKYYEHYVDECDCCHKGLDNIWEILQKVKGNTKERGK
jgi:NADH:ubiquinone oxidoreductase subunit F (NADH-binding)